MRESDREREGRIRDVTRHLVLGDSTAARMYDTDAEFRMSIDLMVRAAFPLVEEMARQAVDRQAQLRAMTDLALRPPGSFGHER